MIVKCYSICQGNAEIFVEYANPAHKSFLAYQLNSVLQKITPASNVQPHSTSNGTWYFKTSEISKTSHLVLLQGASPAIASALIAKGIQLQSSKIPEQRLRMKIAEQIRILNANRRMDSLNSNVTELEHMMKGNVNKIISNMSDLETAERKSQRLSALSMQLQNNSRELQEKLKRKACMRKLILAGIGGAVGVFLIYYFFL